MNDLSLHILDVAQNSLTAGATCVELAVRDSGGLRRLTIADNGCGMDSEMLARVTSPFATTRKTRKGGLGLPLLKMSAELTGGGLWVESQKGKGTVVTAEFVLSNIDCPPLGDMGGTMQLLVQQSPGVRFIYRRQTEKGEFALDTDEVRAELDGVPLDHPEVLAFIRQFVNENEKEIVEVHQ